MCYYIFIRDEQMNTTQIDKAFKELPENRQKIALEFVKSLKKSHKLRQHREELEARRKEIKQGQTLSHDDFWK